MSKTNYHIVNNKKAASYKELSQLIVAAIEEEQFFNKEVLVPKIKAILSGFKMNLDAAKYNSIEKPSDAARRIRAINEYEVIVNFWKCRVRELVPDITPYYHELNKRLVEKGFNPKPI